MKQYCVPPWLRPVLLLLLAALPGSETCGATFVVGIRSYYYTRTNLLINAGDTVLWTNQVSISHDVMEGQTNISTGARLFFSGALPVNGTFSYRFTNAGSYHYFCSNHLFALGANNHAEQTGTVTVTTGNLPPTVNITNPVNNASFPVPTNVTLSASAADTNGAVSSVSFFAGPNYLGSAVVPPYTLVASNLFAGTYSFTARATDNLGSTTTSTPVNITIRPRTNIVAVTNFTFIPNTLTINAGDLVLFTNKSGTHTVSGTGVEPFCGAGAFASPGFCSVTFSNAGVFGFQCNIHPSLMSGLITVVGPPKVSVTSPSNGSVFTAPASFTLGASASKAGGSIVSVEFFNGATSLGTDSASPYAADVTLMSAGNYTLMARATDSAGFTAFAPVNVLVQESLPQLLAPGILGNLFQFDVTTVSGLTYVVQGAPMLQASWISIQTNVASSGVLHFVDPVPVNSNRIYRAFRLP